MRTGLVVESVPVQLCAAGLALILVFSRMGKISENLKASCSQRFLETLIVLGLWNFENYPYNHPIASMSRYKVFLSCRIPSRVCAHWRRILVKTRGDRCVVLWWYWVCVLL